MLPFNIDYPPVLLKKYLCPLRSLVTKQRRFVMLMLSHSFRMQKFPDLKSGGEKIQLGVLLVLVTMLKK